MTLKGRNRSRPQQAAIDFLVVLLMIFTIIALTEKPKANPPRIDTLGMYAVVVTWPAGSNDDVDTYVRDPAGDICYFAATGVGLMHLEQDDTGTASTGTITVNGRKIVANQNTERVILRGTMVGEYIANIHMYAYNDPGHPVKVTVQLWRLRGNDELVTQRTLTLSKEGQELTAFRFTINAAQNITNTNTLPRDIVYESVPH